MVQTDEMLNETILAALTKAGKTTRDVAWIGTRDGLLTVTGFADFAQIAQGVPVGAAPSLVVVGLDWWMELEVFLTAYSWKYHQRPHRKMGAKRLVFRRDEQNRYRLEAANSTA